MKLLVKALIKELSEASQRKDSRKATLKASKTDRKTEDGRTIFKVPGSTIDLDRADEILIPKGCLTDNYLKNPVILLAHDYAGESYGKTLELEITDNAVNFDFIFSNDETGKRLEQKYADGIMSAFSVSFIPRKEVPIADSMSGVINIDLSNGEKVAVNLDDYPRKPRNIVAEWELLELSAVAVPCNQDAVSNAAKALAEELKKNIKNDGPVKMFKESEIDRLLKVMNDTVGKLLNVDSTVKAAVPVHSTPIDSESEWNGDEAVINLARGSSEDGSGEKDKIDFSKYALGFAWFDENAATNLTSYKLPHHIYKDDELVGIWRGVVAAMAALLGARGGVDLPDDQRRAVYDHLAAHYVDAGMEAPEFRTYTEEELKELFPDLYPEDQKEEGDTEPENSESADEGKGAADTAGTDETIKRIAAVEAKIDKIFEGVLNLGVKLSVVYESILKMKTTGPIREDDDTAKALKALNEKISNLLTK